MIFRILAAAELIMLKLQPSVEGWIRLWLKIDISGKFAVSWIRLIHFPCICFWECKLLFFYDVFLLLGIVNVFRIIPENIDFCEYCKYTYFATERYARVNIFNRGFFYFV